MLCQECQQKPTKPLNHSANQEDHCSNCNKFLPLKRRHDEEYGEARRNPFDSVPRPVAPQQNDMSLGALRDLFLMCIRNNFSECKREVAIEFNGRLKVSVHRQLEVLQSINVFEINIYTLCAALRILGVKHFNLTRQIYDACVQAELKNLVMYNTYITAAGNCGQFEAAQGAYEACLGAKLADVVTYNSYITAAGNCGRFEEVQRAYKACGKFATVVTHSSYITAAGNCGQFEAAQGAYEACLRAKLADVVTYNSYITAAANCRQFEAAQGAYNTCVREELANVVTHSSYITAAGNCGQFKAARGAYNHCIQLGRPNVVTYNSYITAAGNCGQFEAAQGAYNTCVREELANVVTYNSYITVAGNCGQFEQAKRAYEACLGAKLAGVVTHNIYITAAGNCGQFEAAQGAYEACLGAKLADVVTHSSYITAMLYRGVAPYDESSNFNPWFYFEEGNRLWQIHLLGNQNRRKLFEYPNPMSGRFEYTHFNLHDLSEGEALLACYYIFNGTQDATIIIGKGLHSRGNNSKIRNIVFNFARRYGITVTELKNEGRIECHREAGMLGWRTPLGMLTLKDAVSTPTMAE